MRNYSLEYVRKLVQERPTRGPAPAGQTPRRPRPFPGRKHPVRVAWYFQLADRDIQPDPQTGKMQVTYRRYRSLSYVGKPSRYRALEARKFLRAVQSNPTGDKFTVLLEGWQAEFDKEGLTAYKIQEYDEGLQQRASQVFWAYHPHSSDAEIVEAFCKPLYLKYVGGMRLYSQKRKLAQEAVDAYYSWYQEQFKRKLKRPKSVPTAIVAGEQIETETEPQQ